MASDHLLNAELPGRFSARPHEFSATLLRSEGGIVARGDSRVKAKTEKSGETKKGEMKEGKVKAAEAGKKS